MTARLLGTALLAVGAAHAQEALLVSHLTVRQGLSQGDVMCSFQDSRGFMWFGTQDGLNRYDGYALTVFRHDPAVAGTLDDGWILSIGELPDGTLCVETRGKPGMLNRFDPATETFRLAPRDSLDWAHARRSALRSSYVDPFGARWSGPGAIGGGLERVDPSGRATIFRHDPANPASLIDDRVYSVCGDRKGRVWIATHEGLDRFERETGAFIHYQHDERNPASLSDNWVWPVIEDRTGALWVGTFRGGLNRLDPSTGAFTRYRHDDADARSLSDNRIYSLYQDRSGIIWVGTGEHGVDRFQPEQRAFARFAHQPDDPGSLLNDNVLSAFVDREGILWVGTRAGLDRRDPSTGTFRHFIHSAGDPSTIADNQVQSFAEDAGGALWLGTVSNGLDRMDRATLRCTHFQQNPARPGSLSDNRVYALCIDAAGTLWAGTYAGGLNRFDRARGTFTVFRHSDSIAASLSSDGVWALCADHTGALWVGTFGGGLDRYDPASGTFIHYRHDPANPASLSSDAVLTVVEDHGGTIWVGTFDGLNRLEKGSASFRHYGLAEGLPNEFVFGILEDDRGNLWLSTNNGLSRLDPSTGRIRNYDEADGLQGNEFNQGASARDARTGAMVFGGGNGFTEFQPDSVRDNPYVPPVVFSSFVRYNTDNKAGKPIEERGIAVRPAVTLSYKDNVATFEFAALNYYNTPKNQYAYRLEGYNDTWIQLGAGHRATFTNLDGGEYTLRVRGSNNDGVWNEEGAALRITVLPPWWKSTPAYVAYALLALLGLFLIRRFEINRQAQRALVRESDLRARAAEAEKRALEAENERKTKELDDARVLQLSMLPREVPALPGYEIAVYMKTATEVGGDYYDFSAAPDGALNVAVGDATGHGMQAGTIVTLMKGLFLSDASRFDIQTFFGHASRAIKEIRLGRLFMAFTLLRLKDDRLAFSCAGMPPVFLYRAAEGAVEEILLGGMPLGAMKSFPYALHGEDLRPGDAALLLTDGLPEQKNGAGEMFDYARVRRALEEAGSLPAGEIIGRLTRDAEAWLAGHSPDDDITLLVIRKSPLVQ
ncbi:MAG TPA: two-component regulator propeller domain-containing protein [Bacteroidota bacterium]|nr:two-component regulator propeller domain-containing protein [Bacteroidota bacterium]